jgi:arylsulfatase A-like enzyme
MPDRPNILIVMTDHQRGDTVLPEHPTIAPNVEALAREGVTFARTFCPAPHCCPARATFHSGLYPTRTGVWNNICNGQALATKLNDGVRLFGEDLAAAGYRMVYTGKWHVSTATGPGDHGWEERDVSCTKGDRHGVPWDYYRRLAGEPERTERGDAQILRPGYGDYSTYGTRGDQDVHDDKVTAEGVKAIGELAAGDGPWAVYVGLTGPHDPYYVPPRFLDMYDPDAIELPASFADDLADKPRIYRRMRRQIWGQLTEREVREAIRHFRAYCTYLDDLFGQLLRALDDTGQADDTLVLFTSDHGDYCGEHGLFAKGIPSFRGAYHVPAVVRWPAGVADPGRRVERFVSLADFAPTFTELAGGSPAPDLSGRSLAPFLAGETPDDWRDEIHMQCNGVELYYTQRIVQTDRWKYVFNGFDDDELYDLQADPDEMHNVIAGAPEAVVRDMCGRMWRFAATEGDTAINPYITVGLAPFGPAQAFRP